MSILSRSSSVFRASIFAAFAVGTAAFVPPTISVASQAREAAPGSAPGGFLFATFRGESGPMGEQVYFALSRDGRTWSGLGDGRPVLVSELGEKGVRDPFLLRAHEGDKFYLIGTDLSIHHNRDWGRAVRAGSRSLVVWESTDLVRWSEPRLVRVAPDDAGCSWAPEAIYDVENGDYIVFWASTTGRDDFEKHRIWAARTRDFREFGEPFVFIEKPTTIIDTTIVHDGQRYHRFTKDEKHKAITLESAERLSGPWVEQPDFSLAKLVGYEGPQCYLIEPARGDRPPTWGLIIDHYAAGRGYQPYVTHDLSAGRFEPAEGFSFPFPFRHGSVLSLTAEEYDRLVAADAAGPGTIGVGGKAAPHPALAWTNPIVPQRADPHVFLHTDGWYYLAATVPEYDRIEIRRARTLGGLSTATPKVIWRKHATGVMGAHIWAPEIHFIDGKWYVYFSAGEAEQIWAIRLWVLECAGPDPLADDWIERGKLTVGWESFTLDATTFEHRGVRYLAWTQAVPDVRGTNIYLARMDTPTSIAGEITLLTRPDFEWERRGHWVTEAPAVLIKNGRVWMTYSASATDANYCLGLLSAPDDADLLDASVWTKSPEPVLRSDPQTGQFGPGHNSFTTTPDGETDILVYHARNYERIEGEPLRNPDRATRAQVIRWRADGSPDFGPPVADGPYAAPPSSR
jgi:GH43 family beta-xylosidase